MTQDGLETAIREAIPLAINMADGRQNEVRSRDRVILAGTRVVLVEQNIPHVLPLLTMMDVSDLPLDNDAAKS